jgi:hypothetical protein
VISKSVHHLYHGHHHAEHHQSNEDEDQNCTLCDFVFSFAEVQLDPQFSVCEALKIKKLFNNSFQFVHLADNRFSFLRRGPPFVNY